jgi:hypothetical protein
VIRNADLTHLSIEDANLEGMTIDGVPVVELFKAYRTGRPGPG